MKKYFAWVAVLLLMAAPAAAEVRSVQVCQAVTLAASTTTDCKSASGGVAGYDISGYRYFSYQFRCNSASTTISVNLDWVGGSASGTSYLAVPLLSSGTAMAQLRTSYTTESTTTWSTLQSIHPPVSPVATLRFTNNAATEDVICDAILNMGN